MEVEDGRFSRLISLVVRILGDFSLLYCTETSWVAKLPRSVIAFLFLFQLLPAATPTGAYRAAARATCPRYPSIPLPQVVLLGTARQTSKSKHLLYYQFIKIVEVYMA